MIIALVVIITAISSRARGTSDPQIQGFPTQCSMDHPLLRNLLRGFRRVFCEHLEMEYKIVYVCPFF